MLIEIRYAGIIRGYPTMSSTKVEVKAFSLAEITRAMDRVQLGCADAGHYSHYSPEAVVPSDPQSVRMASEDSEMQVRAWLLRHENGTIATLFAQRV